MTCVCFICYIRYDWCQTNCSITIVIYTQQNNLQRADVIIELSPSTIDSTSPQTLHIRVQVSDRTYHIHRGGFFGKYPAYVRYCRSAMTRKLISTGPGTFRRAERKEATDGLDRTSCDSLFHSEMVLGKNEYM